MAVIKTKKITIACSQIWCESCYVKWDSTYNNRWCEYDNNRWYEFWTQWVVYEHVAGTCTC